MHTWAKQLTGLQALQIKIARKQAKLAGMPAEHQRITERYAGEQAAVKEAQDVLKSQELKLRGLDGQIGSIQGKKKEFQAKSSLIKSNDEYRAAMLQIELCDRSISDLEDQQLAIMEEMDAQRKVIEARQETLKEAEARADESQRKLDSRTEELKREIAALESQVPGMEAGIEPSYLAEYLRLRGSCHIAKTLPVLVPLEEDVCGACRMRVTTQVKLNVRKGKLVCCPSCQSMLYWEGEDDLTSDEVRVGD